MIEALPRELHKVGFHKQTCLDFSKVVLDNMRIAFKDLPEIMWTFADIRDMPQIRSGAYDCAVDKGTLDAMLHGSIWDPPEEVVDDVQKYSNEVSICERLTQGEQ